MYAEMTAVTYISSSVFLVNIVQHLKNDINKLIMCQQIKKGIQMRI